MENAGASPFVAEESHGDESLHDKSQNGLISEFVNHGGEVEDMQSHDMSDEC